MSYRGRHGRGSNRRGDAIPKRWERKQAERRAEREEARRIAAQRLGASEAAEEETAPFSPVGDDEAPYVRQAVAPEIPSRVRGRRAPAAGGWSEAEGAGYSGTPVARVLAAAGVALALGSLLTGHQLKANAEQMAIGPGRTVAVIATTPVAWLNRLLFIDRGWRGIRGWASGFMEARPATGGPTGADAAGEAVAEPATGTPAPSAAATGAAGAAQAGAWVRPRTPTNAAPLDVYICGDSMSMDVGAAFVNVSVGTGVIESKRFYRSATGLSRPDAFDWPAELRRETAATGHEAVIAMFGANDGQNVEFEGRVLTLYTPEWEALYARRVGEAMDILSGDGRRLYWIGLPVPRSAKQAKKYAMMNDVYRAEAAKRPGIVYVDSWKLFSDASGGYSELLKDDSGKLVDMRKDDGIHFTMAGANRLAKAVLGAVCNDWGIPEP